MAGNQHGEKMVPLYCLIGSQEAKLAPGHTTSYDQVLLSYSRGMRAGKATAEREQEVGFFKLKMLMLVLLPT